MRCDLGVHVRSPCRAASPPSGMIVQQVHGLSMKILLQVSHAAWPRASTLQCLAQGGVHMAAYERHHMRGCPCSLVCMPVTRLWDLPDHAFCPGGHP